MNSRDGWLRSARSVVLLLAALVTALVMGAAVVSLRGLRADAVALQGEPMTDAQAAGQVVASAKQIVSTAQLQDATGGYAFVSCMNESEPPYQAAIYMSFRLPQSNSVKYLRDVAASMAAHGWARAASMGEHFGQKLTKDGVTVIFYPSVNNTNFPTIRLHAHSPHTPPHP